MEDTTELVNKLTILAKVLKYSIFSSFLDWYKFSESKRNITYSNEKWLKDSSFVRWIEKCQQNTIARCKVCFKNKDLPSVGFHSLVSHASGKKYKAIWSLSSSVTIETFLEPAKTVSHSEEKTVQKKALGFNALDQYIQ